MSAAPAALPRPFIPEPSIAVPDAEADRLILGRQLSYIVRKRLRDAGAWPPHFLLLGGPYVLRSDIEAFIAQRVAAMAQRERGRRVPVLPSLEREREVIGA